jgi:hypothetical protein
LDCSSRYSLALAVVHEGLAAARPNGADPVACTGKLGWPADAGRNIDVAGKRRRFAPTSSIASQLSIHEPSLAPAIWPALSVPFSFTASRAMTNTVWILRNASSVIILHLLSMKRKHAAMHKMAVFGQKVVLPFLPETGPK